MNDIALTLRINGESWSGDVQPRLLLVHLLRDEAGLTGTNVGCDTSNCGACTVLLDGSSVKSCTILAVQAQGAAITTIEGVVPGEADLHPVQAAFREKHALQCGYCTPGMVMSSIDLLQRCPRPNESQVRRGLEGNTCRCTGYESIVDAVLSAAETMAAPTQQADQS